MSRSNEKPNRRLADNGATGASSSKVNNLHYLTYIHTKCTILRVGQRPNDEKKGGWKKRIINIGEVPPIF